MFNQRIVAVFVAMLSTGWIFPLAMGVQFYLEFWRFDALPLLRGETPMVPFPHLTYAKGCFAGAFCWLGLATFAWSYFGVMAWKRRAVH